MRRGHPAGVIRTAKFGLVSGLVVCVGMVGIDPSRGAAEATRPGVPTGDASPQPAATGPFSPSPVSEGPTGNMVVTVPSVPPAAVIERLCEDLVTSVPAEPAVWLPDLVRLTGGSIRSTTSWCQGYLSYHPWPGRTGQT